jgi:glycogen synthase
MSKSWKFFIIIMSVMVLAVCTRGEFNLISIHDDINKIKPVLTEVTKLSDISKTHTKEIQNNKDIVSENMIQFYDEFSERLNKIENSIANINNSLTELTRVKKDTENTGKNLKAKPKPN